MYTTHFRFVYVPKPRVFFGKRALHCFSALLKTKMLFVIFLKRLYCRYHDIFNRFEFQQTVGKTKISLSWYPTVENKISYLFLNFYNIFVFGGHGCPQLFSLPPSTFCTVKFMCTSRDPAFIACMPPL